MDGNEGNEKIRIIKIPWWKYEMEILLLSSIQNDILCTSQEFVILRGR